MRSSAARLLAVLLLFAPMGASPLGLGEIDLRSALNEPLVAEIELEALGRTQLDEITVGLASREAFEQAGITRPLFLTRFEFELAQRPDGMPYIRVTSDQPVKEPFLDFLVEVDWPSGHLLREYTVLLDPPVFLDEEPSPVEAPTAGGAAPSGAEAAGQQIRQQIPEGPATEAAAPPQATPGRVARGAVLDSSPEGGLRYGPVQRSDTLWSIARDLRPDESVSIEQTMMALLKNNPDAFYNNNINQLKAGYVLRISDPALLTEMSRAEAAAAARQQYEAWQDAKRRRAQAAGTRPEGAGDGPAAVAGAPGEAGSGPRLRLVVPEAAEGKALEGTASATEAGAPETAEIDKLREELAMALEQSEVARQENQDLRERLAVLEEQIESMQRLVTLKDDTLAALQTGPGGETAEGQGPATGGAGPQEGATAGQPGSGAAGTQADAQPAPGDGSAPAATQSDITTQRPAPAVAPPPPATQPGGGPEELLNQVLADPMLLGIAGLAVLLLATLAWLVVRRRRAAEETFVETSAGATAEEAVAMAGAGGAAVAAGSGDGEAEVADVFGDTVDEVAEKTPDDAGLDIMQADEEEIDILAEADVYLAYRRFDKAEELLKDAIQSEPDRQELVLKLLEVYAASENKDAFVLQAENLKASLSSEDETVWDKVVAMGRQLAPDHALFSAGGHDNADDGVELTGDDALDASLEADLDGLDLDVDLDAALEQFDDGGDGDDNTDELLSGDAGDELFAGDQLQDAAGEDERREQTTAPLPAEDEGLTLEGDASGDMTDLSSGQTGGDDDLSLDEQTLAELGDLGADLELTDTGGSEAQESPSPLSPDEDREDKTPALELETGDGQPDTGEAPGTSGAADELSLEEGIAGLELEAEPEQEQERPEAAFGGDGEAADETQPAALGEDLDLGQEAGHEVSADVEEPRLTGTDDAAAFAGGEALSAGGEDVATGSEEGGDDWLSGLGGDIPDLESDDQGLDEEFSNLISGDDEVGTKLDLAKAYIDMGDQDSARNILSEVASEGSEDQQREANELMQQMG